MTVYNYGNPDADIVLIQPVDSHVIPLLEKEVEEIKKLTEKDFYFVAYQVENWNKDLSPWCAQAVFGVEDFGGGADETLKYILKLSSAAIPWRHCLPYGLHMRVIHLQG